MASKQRDYDQEKGSTSPATRSSAPGSKQRRRKDESQQLENQQLSDSIFVLELYKTQMSTTREKGGSTMLKLCVLFAVVALSRGGSPNITLYSGTQQTGAALFLTDYCHDLKVYNFDDATESICGHGAWLLYEDHAYLESDFTHVFVSSYLECSDLPSY
nr:uncharacterized protein LOC113827881 [Penaeus vannamei]